MVFCWSQKLVLSNKPVLFLYVFRRGSKTVQAAEQVINCHHQFIIIIIALGMRMRSTASISSWVFLSYVVREHNHPVLALDICCYSFFNVTLVVSAVLCDLHHGSILYFSI